jgi:diadenylate cyclase
MGSSRFSELFGGELRSFHTEGAITQTVLACSDMSRSRTGALIVFVRDNQLTEPISTGTIVDAAVTAELLKNIFFVKAPLHDGAVIIKDGRIAAAGCMLPMSNNMNLSRDLGMRHRAGIGMSERSDAVVLIVSEETGAISIAVDGMLKRHLSTETVETLLRKELMQEETAMNRKINLPELFRGKKNE